MARIRSVHPGLFTDEAFMSASVYARLLIIGVWSEAWDDGVFEWKPLTLKARIFPADNVDVADLLAELEGLSFLRSFEVGGKQYGAVRNFRRFQRPKKPNSSGVLPLELRTYVGLTGVECSEVPPEFPTGGEKSPQMEDGEGEEGGKGLRTNKNSFEDRSSGVRSFAPRLPSGDPFAAYEEAELDALQFDFDRLDIRKLLPELWDWTAARRIVVLSERKSAVYGALRSRQDKAAIINGKGDSPPVGVSSELANSKLARNAIADRARERQRA